MDNSEDYEIINRLNGGFAKHHLGFVMSQPNVNQENAIMVGMADMEFKLAPKVYEKLLAKLGTPHFGYTWIKPTFSSTLEAWIRKRYYPEAQIKQDNVIAWVNLFQCYNCILNIITEPNDNLLFITPSYYRFIFQANFLGRKCLEAQLKMKDGTFQLDFQALEEVFAKNKIKMMVLISPSNPCGKVWSREDMTRLKDLVLKNDAYFFCDEIYADFLEPLTEDGHVYDYFTTILQFEDLYPKLIYASSHTKAWNCSGQGLTYMIIKNPQIFKKAADYFWFDASFPTTNSYALFEVVYTTEQAQEWRRNTIKYIRKNYEDFKALCAKKLPKVEIYDLDNTYLCLLDFKNYGLKGQELKDAFTKVDVVPQFLEQFFVEQKPRSIARINLALNNSLLEDLVDRMSKMVQHD